MSLPPQLFRVFHAASKEGAMTIGEDGYGKEVNMRLFWASHQRFFRALLMSFKVPDVAHEVRASRAAATGAGARP